MTNINKLLQGVDVEWKTLGEVVEISNIGVDKKSSANEKNVRLLNFVDIFKNQYISNETPTMVVTASEKKILDCNVKKGDIFITPSSELIDEIGFSAMAIEDFDNTVYSYHIMRLRINNKNILLPAFLNYLFNSTDVRKQIRAKAQGITRFGLTQPNWKSIQIPIPPLKIQKKIVRILDSFTELTAELTAELTVRKQQYNYYRDELLSFEEGEVEWKTLGEVVIKSYSGSTPKAGDPKYYNNGTIPWLRTQEVKFTDIENTEIKITDYAVKNTTAKWIPINCVIIAVSGATAGRSAINKIPLTTNQHCLCLEINPKKALYRYVFHWVSLNYKNLKNLGQGARGDLNSGIIKNYKIPIPPLEEQARIVSILDKFDTLTNSISEGLPKEIALRQKQYAYYRDMLLTFPKGNLEA